MQQIKTRIHVLKKLKVGGPILLAVMLGASTLVYANRADSQATAYAQNDASHTSSNQQSAATKTSKPSPAPAPTTASPTAAPAAAPTAASNTREIAGTAPVAATAAAAIVRSRTLYTDPNGGVASGARAWASANPNDATKMNRLAATPMATWFGDWNNDVQGAAASYVNQAASVGQVPTLVAYNIPQRDCGSYSSGGANSAASYKSWISSFAAGIGQHEAIVIIEPDALAGIDCLSPSDQQTRLQLLSYAVQTLRTQTKAAIYIDAGNPGWQSVSVMAARLTSMDIGDATGFSLNVSNFQTTASNISYGTALSNQLGGKHFVIDTSRNGNGPAGGDLAWCNPDGRAFGNTPSLQTGNELIDGYLWIKDPGESDGGCGAGQSGTTAPAPGTWWPQYAVMLAGNSGW